MAARKKTAAAEPVDALTIEAPTTGTELATMTAEERASAALAFASTLQKVKALAAASTTLVAVDTPDNFAAAKAAKARLISARTTIAKTGKAARDEANKYGQAVIAKERELIAEMEPEETRLGKLIQAEQDRIEAAERAVREAEQARAEALRLAFARIRQLDGLAMGRDLAFIDGLIAEAQATVNDQSAFPEDLRDAARYEANVALNALKASRDRKVQADKDAAELAELRAQRDAQQVAAQRAAANAAEVERATGVVARAAAQAKPADDDDDDLPPGHAPRASAKPARPRTLLEASLEAYQLLVSLQQAGHPTAVALKEAIAREVAHG